MGHYKYSPLSWYTLVYMKPKQHSVLQLVMKEARYRRYSQNMLIIVTHFILFGVIALSGTQAEEMKDVCPREKMKLICPHLEPAIKRGDYKELLWTVFDPVKSEKKLAAQCNENLKCDRYTLGIFDKRVKIRNTDQGMLVVEQLIKDDLLTFACYIEQKQNKPPLVYQMNLSSSVNCLSKVAGQDVNLNQALGKMSSREAIEDMWWYWIKRNGEKQKIVYCDSTRCLFEDCNSSCPQSRFRLKIDGVTLVLMNVTEVDRGLKLECRIYPKIIGRTAANPMPRIYIVKIKHVFPSESFSSTSQSKNLKTPSKTPVQTTSQTPTRSSTAWVHGTQYSASSRFLEITSVLVSLVIAFFENA